MNNHKRVQKRNRKFTARAFVNQYKAESSCVFCGQIDVKELTFHHPKGSDVPQVQRMIQQGYSLVGLRAMLDRLVVVCGGCHRLMEGFGVEPQDLKRGVWELSDLDIAERYKT